MKNCKLGGVPPSLQQDGWWLGPISAGKPRTVRPHTVRRRRGVPPRHVLHLLALAGLIVLTQVTGISRPLDPPEASVTQACSGADVLDFQAKPGLRSLVPVSQRGTLL